MKYCKRRQNLFKSCGIWTYRNKINSNQPTPQKDEVTDQDFFNIVAYKKGKYWVGLPRKTNAPELPTKQLWDKYFLC